MLITLHERETGTPVGVNYDHILRVDNLYRDDEWLGCRVMLAPGLWQEVEQSIDQIEEVAAYTRRDRELIVPPNSPIAASPALLRAAAKALEEIDAHWTRDELEEHHCGMEVARDALAAAIAQAKGA